MPDLRADPATLADALDRVLHRGAVLRADLVVSVADVDLLYLDLRVILASVDTARAMGALPPTTLASPPPSDADAPPADAPPADAAS
jgi:hypothetical protein